MKYGDDCDDDDDDDDDDNDEENDDDDDDDFILPNRDLQITLPEGSDGSPGPALLTAFTRNTYSSPSLRPRTCCCCCCF